MARTYTIDSDGIPNPSRICEIHGREPMEIPYVCYWYLERGSLVP